MVFRLFPLAAWTLLVNNTLCASFNFNWHYCPKNILVLVCSKIVWLSFVFYEIYVKQVVFSSFS